MRTYTTFTVQDYEGEFNLLKQEKKLILLALSKTNGSIKLAHKLLCPQPKPHYSYSYIVVQIRRHEISISGIQDELNLLENDRRKHREASEDHRKLVQKNLKKFYDKSGVKLRSLE